MNGNVYSSNNQIQAAQMVFYEEDGEGKDMSHI